MASFRPKYHVYIIKRRPQDVKVVTNDYTLSSWVRREGNYMGNIPYKSGICLCMLIVGWYQY